MRPQLSFIILTWNSVAYIRRCFDSIASACDAEGVPFEIIAIDNGSSDESCALIREYILNAGEKVSLIALDRNYGTTYPRNLGLKKAEGRIVCILDSDTQFRTGSISMVIDYLTANASVGMIAPRLIYPDGVLQPSVKKFPTFIGKLLKIPKAVFKLKMPDFDFYPAAVFSTRSEVDTAISACWLFRKELIRDVGLLDEKIFYAPEDLDYCVRVRKAGLKIVYWPELTITHHTQQISHRSPFSKVSRSHFGGLLYYYWKHGGWLTTCHLPKLSKRQHDYAITDTENDI